MADLLTHILTGYIIGMLLGFRYDWIRAPHVTLVMIGAASPDLMRIDLVMPAALIEATLGIPFAWRPLHYLGGNLLVLLIGALLIAPQWRKRAFLFLLVGAASHHVLDLLLLSASAYSYPVLWPITEYHPPSGMVYRSTDRLPAVLALVVAGAVYLIHRRFRGARKPQVVDE